MSHTKERKKELGAFYTPDILADLLARMVLSLCKLSKNTSITSLDPAMGDGVLLKFLLQHTQKRGFENKLIGIDIDEIAITSSNKRFCNKDCQFIHTDALYPLGCSTPSDGWKIFSKKYLPNGVDIIVSNPPWGANIEQYTSIAKDFNSAIGQFDIYDLFIETIIANLKEGGVYGIIVPDSIYNQEHYATRKLLLSSTTLKGIIRLGEGFFSDVNFAVSIIYGIKKKPTTHSVACAHLTNSDKKAILSGESSIYNIVKKRSIKVPVKRMFSSDYSFTVDVSADDIPILSKLRKYDTLSSFISCKRGVELSKRGYVLQCLNCMKWFPEPRRASSLTKCPHCGCDVVIEDATRNCIISAEKKSESEPLIVGEDIGRYIVSVNRYIAQNISGIKYKPFSMYKGPKVVVRKTGVGLSAGIDYTDSYVNQVVYIIKPKETVESLITTEVISAFLCSRILTYVIIKEKGSIGWTSNPYLSQKDVETLPFPIIDYNDEKSVLALQTITNLVQSYIKDAKVLPLKIDAEIEKNVAYLYKINQKEYKTIMSTISQVEQMIPFSRLLNIKTEDIFRDGI